MNAAAQLASLIESIVNEKVEQILAKRRRVDQEAAERIVSLDEAAKLLRRRRCVVLDAVRGGRIRAKIGGTKRRPIYRIRVADLREITL